MTRKWTRGRRTTPDETVQIEDESGHEWWAARDELATPIDRRWRKQRSGGQYPFRRAADRTVHGRRPDGAPSTGSPFFAPPEDEPTPSHDWSTESLHAPPADEPYVAPSFAPADPEATAPWSELGLTSAATWDEVVARHRELAKEHHPDRHSLGAGDARRLAELRMAAINAAFQDLDKIYRATEER